MEFSNKTYSTANETVIELRPQKQLPDQQYSRRGLIYKKFVELSKDSTGHGYHNIYRTDKIFLRIWWTIFFLAGVAFCAHLIVKGVINFVDFNVTSKIRLVSESEATFPMITICNTNAFVTSKARDFFVHLVRKLRPDLSESDLQIITGNDTNGQRRLEFYEANIDLINSLQSLVASSRYNDTLKQSFGYNRSEMFIEYSFGPEDDIDLSPYITWFYNAEFGNCFNFNSGLSESGARIPLLKQDQTGIPNGLYMTAFVDVYKRTIYNFMNFDPYKIYAFFYIKSNPLKSSEIVLRTYIGIRKTISKILPTPYSECVNIASYDSILYREFEKLNKTYQQDVCVEMCKQQRVLDECGCAWSGYPHISDYDFCSSFNDVQCALNLSLSQRKKSRDCIDQCPLECESVSYDIITSTQVFPDPGVYYEYLKSNAMVKEHFRRAGVNPQDITYEDLANSLSCFYIYYDDLKYTSITESPTMDIEDLLAYIGAVLSLCIGLSFMSFCEVFEILFEIFLIIVSGGGRKSTTSD